jgi:hypothetical protein
MIFKLIIGSIVASAVAIFSAALSLFILSVIVNFFKLNDGQDAYWVFNIAFYVAVVFWVLSFFFSVILMEK